MNKYFKNGHELLWPQVKSVISDPQYAVGSVDKTTIETQLQGYGVTFTGHSLGGALAALAAARTANEGFIGKMRRKDQLIQE